MHRSLILLGTVFWAATAALAADKPTIKCPSPDGRFALCITRLETEEVINQQVDLIEKSSGKVVADLGAASSNYLSETVLVWSADSRWVAYSTRVYKEGQTDVYIWNGSEFENVPLPDQLPDPDIHFGKWANEGVKNYGGVVKAVRWLKPGKLELSNDLLMLGRESGLSFYGIVRFVVAFDAQHHASVVKTGKTKTRINK